MAKDGKRARWREASESLPDVDEHLFGTGLSVSDYSLSPDGVISFKDKAGREFDLLIDHPRLEAAIKERLEALGAKKRFNNGRSPPQRGLQPRIAIHAARAYGALRPAFSRYA